MHANEVIRLGRERAAADMRSGHGAAHAGREFWRGGKPGGVWEGLLSDDPEDGLLSRSRIRGYNYC